MKSFLGRHKKTAILAIALTVVLIVLLLTAGSCFVPADPAAGQEPPQPTERQTEEPQQSAQPSAEKKTVDAEKKMTAGSGAETDGANRSDGAENEQGAEPTKKPKVSGGEKRETEKSGSADELTGQPAEQQEHTHQWIDVTDAVEVWVPKIETVEEWETRKVPTTGDIICNCGARFKNTDKEGHEQHVIDHILAGEPDNFWWETVWVDEQVKVQKEVDNGHYETQTYVLFQYCECGAIQ